MKNCLRLVCWLAILNGSSIVVIHAQDLTGIWRGHFRSNDGVERLVESYDGRYKIYDDRYKMEVQIAQTRNHFEAVTYSYKNTEFYGKATASGSLNIDTKKVLLKEGKLLEVRYANGFVCIMTCFMQYSKLGNDEYLQGTYYSTSVNDTLSGCGKGSIFLHRVVESDFHKEPFLEKKEKELLAQKKENPPAPLASVKPPVPVKKSVKNLPVPVNPTAKASAPKMPVKKKVTSSTASHSIAVQKNSTAIQPVQIQHMRDSSLKISQPTVVVPVPAILKSRKNELLKTLIINHNMIEIRIYDDGAIDNDTVSVYYDNKLLISKARLSDLPITMKIAVEPSEHPHQLVMVAENLGDIPPNTSLLVVVDGEKRYEERIISTEQKNVMIDFQYKKLE
ncbi:MAG TPA: hypothetical protein VK622_13565 [Puia sp.]|nr:hypothetical protein [Puia sp.]